MKLTRLLLLALLSYPLFIGHVVSAQVMHYGIRTQPKSPATRLGAQPNVQVLQTADPPVQPVIGSHIYLFQIKNGGSPNSSGTSLIDCSLAGNGYVSGPDVAGNCYGITDSSGYYNLSNQYTNYYNNCEADDSRLYAIAIGGQRLYTGTLPDPDPTLENALIAEIAVAPYGCYDMTQQAYFNMSDLSTVAAAYALAPFANQSGTQLQWDGFSFGGKQGSTVGTNGYNDILTAFVAANNLVPTTTATNAASFGSTVNSTVQETMNTMANVLVACMVTNGSTSAGTPCANLFSYATAPNLQNGGSTNLTPNDIWQAALYMVENPANSTNLQNEWGLIAAPTNPVWSPTYTSLTSLPSTWDIENSSTTTLGGPVIANLIPPGGSQVGIAAGAPGSSLYINGSNLVGSCGVAPAVVVDGVDAAITFSSNSQLIVTVPAASTYKVGTQFQGYVGVYSCGMASNFIPYIVQL